MTLLQRSAFLNGEGDAYMERNRTTLKEVPADDPLSIHIREHIPDEGRLLEIGCANGARLASVIADRNLRGYGIDPSGVAIREGSERFPLLKLSVGVADKLPFEDSFFSVVMCGFCLYLVDRESLTRVVAEVDRVLVTGGSLIIWDFDPVVNNRNP
jgi:ubiquinone/menaquinone biosynthesis C-methylase UbiE